MALSSRLAGLLCFLFVLSHARASTAQESAETQPATKQQWEEVVEYDYCLLPEDDCKEGGCSPPVRGGLFDAANLKREVGEAHIWRRNELLFLTIKAHEPYTLSTNRSQHMRLYLGAHLPASSTQAQYIDAFREIPRPVSCATVNFNLQVACLPGCIYRYDADRCLCAPRSSRGPFRPEGAPPLPTTRDLFHRASIYLSLRMHLSVVAPTASSPDSSPSASSAGSSAGSSTGSSSAGSSAAGSGAGGGGWAGGQGVEAVLHSINWKSVGASDCSRRVSGGASGAACLPTVQLPAWGAVVEWRNPDHVRHVPKRIAEFRRRQGHLHRHIPHHRVVPGMSLKTALRTVVRRWLELDVLASQAGELCGTPTAAYAGSGVAGSGAGASAGGRAAGAAQSGRQEEEKDEDSSIVVL